MLIGVLFGLLTGMLHGVSTVFARKGMQEDGDTDTATTITLLVNTVILFLVIVFKILALGQVFVINWYAFGLLALSGFTGAFLGRAFLFASAKRVGASKAASLKILSPLFTAVIAYIFLRELISLPGYAGVIFVVCGLYWLNKDNIEKANRASEDGEKEQNLHTHKIGMGMALICAFSYAIAYIFRKQGITVYPYPLEAPFVEVLCASIYFLLYFLGKGKITTLITVPRQEFKCYFISGIASAGALFCNYFALQFIPVTIVTTLVSTQAYFAIVVSSILKETGEDITKMLIAGSTFIFIGIAIIILF